MVSHLDKKTEIEISDAIRLAEAGTSGEIRVHVRRRSKGDTLSEAKKIFERLKMHKTAQRNGVLIYVALDSRQFAIIGDSGIHQKVGDLFWSGTRDKMVSLFAQGEIKAAILAGVADAGGKLKDYFPAKQNDKNELPDTITKD